MDITLSHCFLAVDDQDKALAFYRDVLGLEVRTDVQFDDMRWLTVGSASQPGIEIGLLLPGGPMHSQADRDAAIALVAKGLAPGVIFLTPDVDKTFERVSAAGAEVTQEPIDQPYGVRDCGFRDPSGNHIRFSQVTG
jgi:catechol 2,3-dioxygenase-like lactoylglutathione lyase family enzyme